MSLRGPLPRLLLIGDRFTEPAVTAKILEAAALGIHWIQLRDLGADDNAFLRSATALVDSLRARSPDILISVNTRVGVAERLGCAVHVGKRGPSPAEARSLIQPGLPVGRSVHALNEIESEDADYLIWSPVFKTTSKPDQEGSGLDELGRACTKADPIPVIAMGGITPERVSACVESGAYGVAVLSGILGAESLHYSVAAYLNALESKVA